MEQSADPKHQAALLERLKRSESQLAEAQALSHIGSWDWDVATNTVTWSDELYRIFGLTPQSFGATFEAYLERVHPDDRDRVEAAVRHTLATGEPMDHTQRIVRPDGTEAVLRSGARRIPGADGNSVRLVGMCRDITREYALQEQVLRMQRMDAVGQLSGGIAHDFNNLLTVILSHCELVARALDDPERIRESVAQIREAASSAAGMTRQLLTFARGDLGPKAVLDLSTALRKAERMLGRLIGETIDLTVEVADDVGRVQCSPTQLEQVLVNLVVNARDAMPDGGSLALRARHVRVDHPRGNLQPDDYVLLEVADTGVGMSADVVAHAFEPFFSTKPAGRGAGLGLSTVYGIVTKCGGDVAIDSEPGRGTTVRIWHPVTSAPLSQELPALTPTKSSGAHVLVVEDSERLGQLIATVLREGGYRVEVAAGADDALARLRDSAPDVLITDVVMPGMSGVELANRAREQTPELAVIYMSGYPSRRGGPKSQPVGERAHFLSKPFTPDQLTGAIEAALARG